MAYNYTYHLTSKACTDLEEIPNYLSGNLANPTAASRFWSKLNAVIQETQSFPFSGPTAPYVLPQDTPGMPVRKKLVNQYVMFYLADSKQERIIILRVIHGRQDTLEILRTLEL